MKLLKKSSKILIFIAFISLCCIPLFSKAYPDPGDGGGGGEVEILRATHRVNWDEVWVEVTLQVIIYTSWNGEKTFYYSMEHARGIPWYMFWVWGSGEGTSLYEQEPGLWTAKNQRYALFVFFPIFGCGLYSKVHFNEAEMQFYYSEAVWDNGALIIEMILEAMEPDW